MNLREGVWAILVVLALCFAVDLICDEDHGADFGQELDAYTAVQPRRDLVVALPLPAVVAPVAEPNWPPRPVESPSAPALPAPPSLDGPSGLSPPFRGV